MKYRKNAIVMVRGIGCGRAGRLDDEKPLSYGVNRERLAGDAGHALICRLHLQDALINRVYSGTSDTHRTIDERVRSMHTLFFVENKENYEERQDAHPRHCGSDIAYRDGLQQR